MKLAWVFSICDNSLSCKFMIFAFFLCVYDTSISQNFIFQKTSKEKLS